MIRTWGRSATIASRAASTSPAGTSIAWVDWTDGHFTMLAEISAELGKSVAGGATER
jgi:hypothetical protein